MIQRVYERACQASINEIYIATDSEKIQKIASRFTEKIIMTSSQHQSGSDRVAEAAKKIDCDYIINLQADEPLMHPSLLDLLDKKLREENFGMFTAAYPITSTEDIHNPSKVKVVLDSENRAIYFSRSPIPYRDNFSKENFTGDYFCHLGVYGFTKEFLLWFSQCKNSKLEKTEKLEQLRVLEFGKSIRVIITEKQSMGIDNLEDVQEVLKSFKLEDY